MTAKSVRKIAHQVLPTCVWLGVAAAAVAVMTAQQPAQPAAQAPPSAAAWQERAAKMSAEADARGLAEPFKGVTADGNLVTGLFPVRSTGVSTQPVRAAAEKFLASLTPAQRARTSFGIDDPEWRKWMNQHFYVRQGTGFVDMTDAQRDAAFALLQASLSAKGLRLTRDIMRLNTTLAEINDDNFVEYGEGRYWITVMGTPSDREPWGWQLDGHHCNVNYFVLGDQVVMTPAFFGSEPAIATAGKYKGTTILETEQTKGLAFVNSLTDAQRAVAILEPAKTANNNLGEAFRDNIIVPYRGVRADALTDAQRTALVELLGEYVGNMDDGHATVRMAEVRRHLPQTYFAWIGGTQPDSVFYYRIHSPVILVEFDHQQPVGLRRLYPGSRAPIREHVHTLVRTPNGNDYGKDLLRQHYEAQRGNAAAHGHATTSAPLRGQ